jgi:hypothetical protein
MRSSLWRARRPSVGDGGVSKGVGDERSFTRSWPNPAGLSRNSPTFPEREGMVLQMNRAVRFGFGEGEGYTREVGGKGLSTRAGSRVRFR